MEESNTIFFIIIAICIMLLLAISLILFFNLSQKKILAAKERNHQQKMDYQKEMLSSTIRTQEEERSRIARELHDDLGSKLNVVNMNVELLKLKSNDSDHLEILEVISSSLGESIDRSRKISHELMPPVLEKFGLHEALHDLSQRINFSDKLSMKLTKTEELQSIKGQNKLHIFRIIQELCNNTLKHADAEHIALLCETTDPHLIKISYSDDGKGMDATAMKSGIGMLNIETRIQILGASWEQIPSMKGVSYELIISDEKEGNIS